MKAISKTFRIAVPDSEVSSGLTSLRELRHVTVTGDSSEATVSDLVSGRVLFTIKHFPNEKEAEVTRINIPDTVSNEELREQLEDQWKQLADRSHLGDPNPASVPARQPITGPTLHELTSRFNEFKMSIEAAFQRMSADISELARSKTIQTDVHARSEVFNRLQDQLRQIRNAFHAFNFGIGDPTIPSVRDMVTRSEYDNDPLGTSERLRRRKNT